MKSKKIKILTDISIPQSIEWGEKTDNIIDFYPYGHNSTEGFDNIRYLLYYSYHFIKSMKHYDVVITANIKLAQLVGMYRALFFISRPKQFVLELMLDEETPGILWKLKLLLQRLSFSSIEVIFVSSTSEIRTYSRRLRIPEGRFRFLPFHTNIVIPRMTDGHERYIFSAGKTGRDYKVLADALRGTGIDAVIVSDDIHVEGIDLPPNVTVRKNIPYSEYMELLEKSILVVVPLKRLVKSTGQVVVLEAQALGKPVIVTETVGTLDYIEHGANGILVPPEDVESLRKAIIELISCPSARDSLARNGLERIHRSHTFEVYIRQILLTAEEALNDRA